MLEVLDARRAAYPAEHSDRVPLSGGSLTRSEDISGVGPVQLHEPWNWTYRGARDGAMMLLRGNLRSIGSAEKPIQQP
jgi:hypothetical protein